jgi:6-phosphogluconolactonase
MKLNQLGRRLTAAASVAGLSLLLLSCGASNTIDFVYVTSNLNNPGQINAFEVNSESGALRQIADSPYPSGGRNPVYIVTAPSGKFLYVANHDDNTIVQYAIGTDGKLYPLTTTNTPGTEPVALAINSSGTALYVLDYYAPAAPGQPSYTDLNPGPGALIAFPITSTGTLGTPLTAGNANYYPVQCFPTSLAVTPDGNFVYITACHRNRA